MKKLVLLFVIVCGAYRTYGQICGTPHPANPRIYSSREGARGASSAYCVDVFFHIVRNTNGTNAFTPPITDAIVRKLNEVYSPHHIVINNAGTDFIDNTNLLIINTSSAEVRTLFRTKNGTDVINFYIIERFTNSRVAGLAQNIPSRNLVMNHSYVMTNFSAHELGHCLNLYHTFYGSVREAYTGSCAEAIDGSNCRTCGDYVCDTPADNGRRGNGYKPDKFNIMAYYLHKVHFTNGQGARMRMALASEPVLDDITVETFTDSDKITIKNASNLSNPYELYSTGYLDARTYWNWISLAYDGNAAIGYHDHTWEIKIFNAMTRNGIVESVKLVAVRGPATIRARLCNSCGMCTGWKEQRFSVKWTPQYGGIFGF